MQPSIILTTTARYLLPVLLLFAAFLFARGHNAPGGGFIAGLVATGAIALHEISDVTGWAPPARGLIGAGLAVALASGLWAMLRGAPLLTGSWIRVAIGREGMYLGTPLLFDLGVLLVVIGTASLSIRLLMEE